MKEYVNFVVKTSVNLGQGPSTKWFLLCSLGLPWFLCALLPSFWYPYHCTPSFPGRPVVMGSCQMTFGPAKSFAYSDAHCSAFTSNSQTALISEWYLVSVMTDPEWAESSHNPRKCEKAVAKDSQVQTLNGYFGKKAHKEEEILSQLLLLD